MTNEEKLKLVAEYMEYPTYPDYKYQNDYEKQIHVWQKVCNDFLRIQKDTDDLKEFMLIKERYCKNICYGDVYNCFEILVQAIQFLNQLKNK